VPSAARARNIFVLDATCPLVFKVHIEAARHHEEGLQILLIGHAGHPEVVGTMGQLPDGAVTLIETAADAERFAPLDAGKLAFVTQTTLSVDDTAAIVGVLRRRFPSIVGPHKEDICYATTNRQAAVKAIAPKIGCLLVVGSPQSSNSLRLVEVAERAGCPTARLIEGARDIPWTDIEGLGSVGVTAGASAPETLVEEVIDAFRDRFDVKLETVTTALERIAFNVPRELRPNSAA
jgi:4-hydroxy-3-methylbut-2-enyl diphosphate reductase